MVGTRGTTPHEENPAAPDEDRGTINFKAVWSGFKAVGWTSKPPRRGIGTLWKYILSGRDANGAEGVDYLLGEQAVVNHAVQLALKEREERASAAPPVGAAAEDSPALPTEDTGAAAGASAASATEDPPASDDLSPAASTSDDEPEEGTTSSKQPRPTRQTTSPKQTKSTKDTKQPKPSKVSSAKPPKSTENPTPKSSASKSRTSSARSSPTVSPPAIAPSTPRTAPRPSQSSPPKRSSTDGSSVDRRPPRSDSHKERDDATNPVASSRKGTDAQSAEAPTEAEQNVRAVSCAVLAAQPLYDICLDNGDDINTDPIGNNDYDVLDSGDESEEEDLSELDVSGSESSASDCIDEDDEGRFAKEERQFADKFLESFGGQEKVLAGELIDPALKDLSTTGWYDTKTPDVAAYLETPYEPVADNDEYPEL
ncbi:hypothetical protein PF008_g5936 [Phytophthora fragariae]|uniref:Uncharacterized protein n=1 Tax=Phytophthora fragariae TaxID=53985 RepID=A0A6G0S737_9STRA|nr:hypothetical protein PF008_g5936 [Phytophthora fragariae]